MRFNNLNVFFGLTILIFFFIVQGCIEKATGPDNNPTGSFNATVEGDVNRSINGSAIFGGAVSPETDERGFIVIMSDEDPEQGVEQGENVNLIWLYTNMSSNPGKGTYVINEDDDLETGFNAVAFINGAYMFGISGEVEITSSSNTSKSGTFTFSATGFNVNATESELNTTVSGAFSASGGETYWPGM